MLSPQHATAMLIVDKATNALQDWMDERDVLRIQKQEADHRSELLRAENERLKESDHVGCQRYEERLLAENEQLRARIAELETGIRKFLDPSGPEAFGLERAR